MGQYSTFTGRTLPGFEIEPDYSKFVIVRVDLHDAKLNWKAVPGADAYRLYKDKMLVLQTADLSGKINQLQSAATYSGYSIVSVNSAGEGYPLPVYDFTTAPDNQMSITSESTKESVTIRFEHQLKNEQLVIKQNGKELYRGSAQNYSEFKQDKLRSDTTYSYEVWTENAAGATSEHQEIKIRTMKERAIALAPQETEPTESIAVVQEPFAPVEPMNKPDVKKRKAFVDIDGSFANESINRLASLGIVNGISEDKFAPKAGTTRAEFMALLTRLTLTPEQIHDAAHQEVSFADIDQEGWYMPELRAALANGIVLGFNKEEFRPDVEIDREQAAKMLSAAIGSSSTAAEREYYSDSSKVSDWAKHEVNFLTAEAIILRMVQEALKLL